jgi:type IV pilus assembly protein PilF
MKIIKLSITLLLLATLSACITVTDSRFSKNANPDKAAETYVALGVSYLRAGDLILARKKIERALEISPDNAAAHGAMGIYWEERGENKLAQQEFEAALDLDDEHSPSNYHYGRFLLQKKRAPRACELLNAAAIDVDFDARGGAYEDLGFCHIAFNRNSKAIDAFEKAWSLDFNSTISTLHLSELYLQRSSIRPAKLWFDRFNDIAKEKSLRHSAASLYLGYRLAKASKDRNGQASYGFKLKKRFPNSKEYKRFKRNR